MDLPKLDRNRQAKAKEYARLRRRVLLLRLLLSGAILVAALFAYPAWIVEPLAADAAPYLAVGLYFVLLLAVYEVLLLPLSIYSGYLLPKRYDLSTQTFGAWLRDAAKGGALSLVLGLIVVEAVYFLLFTSPAYWWLFAAGFMLVFTVVLANLAPILIVPLFFRLRPLEDADLARRLSDLAAKAGARVRGVYVMDLSRQTKAANAALMGLGNTRRIVLGDTLLEDYPPDEIEVVLAHELAHHAHRDIPKGIAVQTGVVLVSFWLADVILRWGVAQLGLGSLADPAGLPLLALVMGAVSLLAMPATNGFTRAMETSADRYAVEMTGKAEAFLTAMTRLANQNLAEVDPPRWVEVLLYDHPPIGKRLALARRYIRADE